ncbi:hypothetical protein [Phytohabitans kaempferiae]|uniref:Uncharacterized protein n=1 Tax=Phytohabitans kaempferiae TaxID=1620943 RepID=A0ABV6LY34_9ACTN
MTTDQSTGRREFYAAVALTDLPMPMRITFNTDEIRMVFDTLAAVRMWAQALGVEVRTRHHVEANEQAAYADGTFAGHPVWLCGRPPAPVTEPPVTGAIRDRLTDLVREVA